MTTKVTDNAAVSQVVGAAEAVRNLEGFTDLIGVFTAHEGRVTEAKLEVGESLLAFLREQLEGLEAASRDNHRAMLMGAIGEDTGYSKSALSALLQAAALNEWVSENLPEAFEENPLLGIAWRVVVSALASCVKRDREQVGEVHVVDVHPSSAAAFCEVLATLASKPHSIEAAKATLAASGVQGLGGMLAFAFTPKPKRNASSEASEANTGAAMPIADKPPADNAGGDAAGKESIAENVRDCSLPADFGGKAFSALVACQVDKRGEAFRALGQQSLPYSAFLLAGLADAIQQVERDSDGLADAAKLLKVAEKVAEICKATFPALGK